MLKHRNGIPQAIREAVDNCPGGLCFSMPDGRLILVNRQMNRLAALITGRTVLDAEVFWAELCAQPDRGGCERLKRPWHEAEEAEHEDAPGYVLPDGTIWQFKRDELKDESQLYIQIEATDITELYNLSRELYENNIRLKELQERQKKLLADIVQINREKELLAVKMRVHDELGQCLIATENALRGGSIVRDSAAIAKGWEDAICDLTNIPLEDAPDASQENELIQVAEMIGCQIEFTGERPADRNVQLLLYAAVREALTNAVRHAGADKLMVYVCESSLGYHAEISDNGRAGVRSVHEGDGLRNLRCRLEQEGATMEIDCTDGVMLILELPCSVKADRRREKW